jgi:hypothetical protein
MRMYNKVSVITLIFFHVSPFYMKLKLNLFPKATHLIINVITFIEHSFDIRLIVRNGTGLFSPCGDELEHLHHRPAIRRMRRKANPANPVPGGPRGHPVTGQDNELAL